MSAAGMQRIVVLVTPQEKKLFTAKAKKLRLPVGDLMLRGAFAYSAADAEEELGELVDLATDAASRACDSVDDVLAFVSASEKRIQEMEAKAIEEQRPTV